MRFLRELAFPLAAAVNFFSVTALIIISGIAGKHELAADIALIQAAIMAAFLALSANARSLILSSSENSIELNLFLFRALMAVPAVALSYWLSMVMAVPEELVFALILRKLTEWFADLELAGSEKRDLGVVAHRYLSLNIIGWLILVTVMLFMSNFSFYLSLFIWALLPLAGIWRYFNGIRKDKWSLNNFNVLLPHIGSSSVIGVCTYIFRVVLVMLVGKASAGGLFAAFAVGGVISSLYTYALGPSIVAKSKNSSSTIVTFFVATLALAGLLVLFITSIINQSKLIPSIDMVWGYSIMGGALMLLAQDFRLKVIQKFKEDTFVPDALANMLIIVIIPFAYYGFGATVMSMLYLLAGGLNLLFFSILFYREKRITDEYH